MSSAFKIAASAVLVGGAVGIWVLGREQAKIAPPSVGVAAPPSHVELAQPRRPDALEQAAEPVRDRVVLAREAAEPAAVAPVPELLPVAGRVIDTSGFPIAGVEVAFGPEGTSLDGIVTDRTDGEGRFELALGAERSRARSSTPTWTGGPDRHDSRYDGRWELRDPTLFLLASGTAHEGDFGRPASFETAGSDAEVFLVAAPRCSFAGRVVDGEGAPVPGATLSLRVRAALFSQLGLGWWTTIENPGWRLVDDEREAIAVRTDEQGLFELLDLCGGEWVFLSVEAAGFTSRGYGGHVVDLPPVDDLELVVVLERSPDILIATGTVIDPKGAPVAGAQVSMGHAIVATDEHGGFRVSWNGEMARMEADFRKRDPNAPAWMSQSETLRVTALMEGFLPAVQEVAEEDLEHPLVLRLGREPGTIEGRVVDPDGAPVEGAYVWLRDPTLFGRRILQQGETSSHVMISAEEALRGGFGKRGARTGADGAFRLGGLFERTYDLQAFDPRTTTLGAGWEVAAGERDVELVLATEPGTLRVAGRVVSLSGDPVADLSIKPRRNASWDVYANPPHQAERDSGVTTDAEGRFAFPRLATEGTQLVLSGARVLYEAVSLADFDDLANLEIVQPLLCELQVDLSADPDRANRLEVLDGDDQPMRIAEFHGAFISHGLGASLSDGMSGLLRVDERARTLVLLRDGTEVDRLPIELDPDERRVIRP